MTAIQSLQGQFGSVEELSEAVAQGGWSTDFRQLDCGHGHASLKALFTNDTMVQHVGFERRSLQNVLPPQGYQTYGILANQLVPARVGNRLMTPDSILCIDEKNGFSADAAPGFSGYTLSFKSERMAELADNLRLANPGEKRDIWGIEIRPEPLRLREVRVILQDIFRVANHDSPGQLSAQRKLLETSLPTALLQACAGASAEKRVSLRNRERALKRALDYIEDNSREAISVETLCVASASSLSTLERAFRERFSVSPKRFIQVQRLHHVHRALRLQGRARSISDIANEWGFWHMGGFAGDYKKLFGYLPSQTDQCKAA
jgi:AraC-like DNA-binding protein